MSRYQYPILIALTLLLGACAGSDGSLAAQGAVRVSGDDIDSGFALGVFTRLGDARSPETPGMLVGYCETANGRAAAGISRPSTIDDYHGLRSFAVRLMDGSDSAVVRVGSVQYRVQASACEIFQATQSEGELAISLDCEMDSLEGESLALTAELHWEGCVDLAAQ